MNIKLVHVTVKEKMYFRTKYILHTYFAPQFLNVNYIYLRVHYGVSYNDWYRFFLSFKDSNFLNYKMLIKKLICELNFFIVTTAIATLFTNTTVQRFFELVNFSLPCIPLGYIICSVLQLVSAEFHE